MTRPTRAAIVLSILFGSAAACGGGDTVEIDDYASAYLAAECAYQARCHGTEVAAGCSEPSNALPWFAAYTASLVGSVHAGVIAYDGARAADCLDALRTRSCSRAHERDRAPRCEAVFTGTLAAGQACMNDAACASGSCAADCAANQCCAGTCLGNARSAPVPVALGAVCADPTSGDASDIQACVEGAYCDVEGTSRCTALRPAATACESTFQCGYGLACFGAPRICRVPPGLGAACLLVEGDSWCDRGTECDRATMTCVRLTDEGEACDPAGDHCRGNLTCSDATRLCTRYPAVGQACVFHCDGRAYCRRTPEQVDGICTALERDGVACADDGQCAGGICDAQSACASPPVCF